MSLIPGRRLRTSRAPKAPVDPATASGGRRRRRRWTEAPNETPSAALPRPHGTGALPLNSRRGRLTRHEPDGRRSGSPRTAGLPGPRIRIARLTPRAGRRRQPVMRIVNQSNRDPRARGSRALVAASRTHGCAVAPPGIVGPAAGCSICRDVRSHQLAFGRPPRYDALCSLSHPRLGRITCFSSADRGRACAANPA